MKKIYLLGTIALMTATSLVSCSDDFLEEKQPYGQYDEAQIYGNYETAKKRVGYLYYLMMPISMAGDGNGSGGTNDYTSVGGRDIWTQSTLEYGGFHTNNGRSDGFVDSDNTLDYQTVNDYFYVINKEVSPWGNIRECNDVIEKVQASSKLTESQKTELLGQAYFFRAYRYWALVKIYGGVPIIDHVQNPIIGNGDGSDKIVPRSTAKDCIEFICSDLEKAAEMLPTRWENAGEDWGRVTAGAALALKGQVELFYASPLFNRTGGTVGDAARWTTAYETNKAALAKLEEGNFGLAYESNPGTNASNWAKMFVDYEGKDNSGISEAVLVSLFNNVDKVQALAVEKWNNWEQSIRPANTNGAASLHPTSEMVDLFPMSDGLKPGESSFTYNEQLFWLNRDPRFYRTFAFPGVEWQFNSGDVSLSGEAFADSYPLAKYHMSKDYQLWSYTWYDNADDAASETIGTGAGRTADLLGTSNYALYLRKKSDDYKVNTNTLYRFSSMANNPKGYQQSAAPIMVMRFAEVLLNFAEAACGAGHPDEAIAALQRIRARVGYTAANNYGLPARLTGDQGKLFGAILYERQVELAYEGKSFDDARRWMLFDGGKEVFNNEPATWRLTAFGGDTNAFTGIAKLNGQRRHNMIVYATQTATEDDASDPLTTRPDGLTLEEDFTCDATGALVDQTGKAQAVRTFYENNLRRKNVNADGNDASKVIAFRPEYYFIGLKQSAQQTNATLLQTVGWYDYSHGGDGTFDPLAE